MATVTTEELQQPWVERPVEAAVKKPPVKVWAVLGALILAFQFYVWGKWITGPYFERVHSGPTEMPHAMKVFQNVYTALGIVAMLGFFYWLLIRPWRRERRVTTDGLLALMWFFLYFQDPIMNYFAHKFTYNSYLLNFGSWTKDIPGWGAPAAPGAMLPEPFLWTAPIYVYALFGLTITANWVMRKAKARFPNLGTFGLIGVCFAFLATLDLILEVLWMRAGFYTYASAVPELTIFAGKWWQFPIYEAVIWGSTWTAFACLRYFKNDKGQTIAERGIDEVRATPKQKAVLRFLALIAVGNIIFFAFYNGPIQWFSLRADAWPESVQTRSYFTDHLCGPGTEQACPSPNLPIPRRDSARFDPQGKVVVPDASPAPGSEPIYEFREKG